MTNQRVGANDEIRELKPVTLRENDAVGGLALCVETVFREKIGHAQELRDRQANYLANLPSDPVHAIKAASQLLHVQGKSVPEGLEEAIHLCCALHSLIKDDDIEDVLYKREAAISISAQTIDTLRNVEAAIGKVSDILGNAQRKLRENRQ